MCKYVGAYFTVTCTYVGYMCMLIISYSRDVLFYVCIIVIIDVVDVYSVCNRSCFLGDCPVCPCPYNFIRAS